MFEEKASPLLTSGDNNKGFAMGYGKIVSENIVIYDVALVAGLEVNLLSVSQFKDKGFEILFNKEECTFISKKTGEVSLKGARKGSLFVAYLDSTNKNGIFCFYTKASEEQKGNIYPINKENHGNGSSSQKPEFDSTNSGGEREEGSSSHTNNEEIDEGTSQQTHTRKWDRSHTREAIIGDPTAM
ncbi:hypothetical protein AgCh_012945 [Apium graveolens]